MTDAPPPPPVLPPEPVAVPLVRVSKLWWVAGPLLLALLASVLWVAIRPVPYIALVPGAARSVEPLITVSAIGDGPKPHQEKAHDDLLFVTVSVRSPSGAEAIFRTFDDTAEVVPRQVVTGGQSTEQNRRFNLQLMTDSKDKATKVALQRAGYDVMVKTTGAVVVDLDPKYPVAKVVQPGDTIVGADGTPVGTTKALVAAIAKHAPGDEMSLTVESFTDRERRTVSVKLRENPEHAGKAQLGVSLEDRPSFTFPFKVDIDSGDIGGPSAGLAFTLALIDKLTPGRLTGKVPVAVTGTIELDGTVGPVGGVAQKTEAAITEGAKVFIVPTDEYADARKAARGRLKVREVKTVDGALALLRGLGGDPLPAPGSVHSGG